MNADEKQAYEYVVSVWGNTIPDCMTYDRFDICDMEGEVNYIAAAEFTRKRLAEIAEVEEEIKWLQSWGYGNDKINAPARMLARERAELAELKRGMMSQCKAATEKEK